MPKCKKSRHVELTLFSFKPLASSGIRAQGRLATGVYKRPLWEEKGLVKRESSYGSLKDNAYSKRLKEPLVVDNKKSESSQNMENLLSFAEKLPPTMKDRKKPQLMRGDVAELKSVIGEKVPYFFTNKANITLTRSYEYMKIIYVNCGVKT